MKKLFLLLLFPCISINAMEIVPVDVRSKEDAIKLYSDNKSFFVENEDAAYRVENHNVNPFTQRIAQSQCLGQI